MFAVQHPIRQLLNSQYEYLSLMIARFPYLLEEWNHKQEKEAELVAKAVSEGDPEIYSSVFNSELSRLSTSCEEEQLFNQAMLIMVYSYYESTVYRIAKESGVSPRPSEIAKKHKTTLTQNGMNISKYIYDYIRPLRNQLCHDNNGTLFSQCPDEDKSHVLELAKEKKIRIDDDTLYIIDRAFIKKTLQDEHNLLIELANICGYKVTRVGE